MAMKASAEMVAAAMKVNCELNLRCFIYEDRSSVMAALLEALAHCGCWVESRDPVTGPRVQLRFTARLEAADELYGGLIAAGAELTRDSHMAMTWLCTLRRHLPEECSGFATISVRLEMNFLDEPEVEPGIAAQGLA